MTYSAKQIETEAAYVVAEIQRDAHTVLSIMDMDTYEVVADLLRICAESDDDDNEVGVRVMGRIFLPAVRRLAIERLDEVPSPFETEAEEHKHFDDRERARDWRRTA